MSIELLLETLENFCQDSASEAGQSAKISCLAKWSFAETWD
ncbi:MAG: hypothetical protein ACE14U_01595 [Candidatus Velamenicoccus archaeovorus]